MALPTLDRVLDAVFRIDEDLSIKFISEAGHVWLGGGAVPASLHDLLRPDELELFNKAIHETPESFACDVRLRRANGECWSHVRGYQLQPVRQYVLCVVDISACKTDDGALRHAVEHDDLTGLPNRGLLKRTVEQMIGQGGVFTLALLDLDGFKKVNDTFGHMMGDAVLVESAKRLNRVIGPDDMVARLGGDEFVLLLAGRNATTAREMMAGVLQTIARPFDTAPHNAYLGVSIGLAEYPEHGADYSSLLKNADTAMYHAKGAGKNRVSVFVNANDSVDFSIKAAIHNGIEEGEFYLEFQPQFDVERRLVGAEALMRWTSRHFGRVSPDQFIPIAEESGLMPFLGRWALRYACHQLRHFQQQMPGFVMSVNVSPVQFGADDFGALVLDAITEAAVDPSCVILEITESTLMHSQEKTERALAVLRQKGVRFSIDDFGTGFSSLAYLTRLPVSSIKIDKSFIRAIEHPSDANLADQRLVTAMINLAHGIDLKVVAEGVENEAQFSFLKESGCNLIQGYLMGKPMPADRMIELLGSMGGSRV